MVVRASPFERIRRKLLETPLPRLFDPQSAERGKKYWEENRVINIDLSNAIEIKARVLGNYMPYYEVIINILRSSQQLHSRCTCPIGKNCKHVAAVILSLRNEWRDAVENHLSLLFNNPMGINLINIHQNTKHSIQKLQEYFRKMDHDMLARTMAMFFANHLHSLVNLARFLKEQDTSMKHITNALEDDLLKELTRIISRCNNILRKELESIFVELHFGDHSYHYSDDLLDGYRYEQFNDLVFMPVLQYLQGINGSLSQVWPLWKVAFRWMSQEVPSIMRDYRDSFISAHNYYIFDESVEDGFEEAAELYFLLHAPIRKILLQFIQTCWSRGNEINNETMTTIFSLIGEVLQKYDPTYELEYPSFTNIEQERKKINQNWIQVLTAAINPSRDHLTFLKKHYQLISKSSSTKMEKDVARMIRAGLRQFELQGRNKSLLKISTVLVKEEEANDFLEFLRRNEYQNDLDFQYQLLMAFLHENWIRFNDLFYEIYSLKDLRDRAFINDLIILFKKTNAIEIVKETFSRARIRDDTKLLDEIHSLFIQAAAEINHQLHVLVLIEAKKPKEAANVFFSHLYPTLIKSLRANKPSYSIDFDDDFLETVLPKIMSFDIEKSQKILKQLIYVNIERKSRIYYQIAAKWAELLRKLLIEIKRRPKEWKLYIEDLLEVRYRRRTALKDEMRHLIDD